MVKGRKGCTGVRFLLSGQSPGRFRTSGWSLSIRGRSSLIRLRSFVCRCRPFDRQINLNRMSGVSGSIPDPSSPAYHLRVWVYLTLTFLCVKNFTRLVWFSSLLICMTNDHRFFFLHRQVLRFTRPMTSLGRIRTRDRGHGSSVRLRLLPVY